MSAGGRPEGLRREVWWVEEEEFEGWDFDKWWTDKYGLGPKLRYERHYAAEGWKAAIDHQADALTAERAGMADRVEMLETALRRSHVSAGILLSWIAGQNDHLPPMIEQTWHRMTVEHDAALAAPPAQRVGE